MRMSLGAKVVAVVMLFALILSGISIIASYSVIEHMNNTHYMNRAEEIADTISRVLNAEDLATIRSEVEEVLAATDERVMSDQWGSPAFDAYVERFAGLDETDEYQRVLAQLRDLQEANDVDCLYTIFIDATDELFVYLVDADMDMPCPIGCLDPLYDINRPVLEDPTLGLSAYITDTDEYGWLVTTGKPVTNEAGEVVCYACVDISMDDIVAQQHRYAYTLALALVVITLVLCFIVGVITRRLISLPLDTLSKAASQYCTAMEGGRPSFEDLNIHTRDEIEDLHQSMVQMEHDIDSYIDNLVAARTQLKDTKDRAQMLSDLARTDALTGVRNKLAYEQELNSLEQRRLTGFRDFGFVVVDLNDLKYTNDTYGHERGDMAIATIAGIICNTYSHSPVYRIGGDEFCAILTDNDFEHAQELEDVFFTTIAEIARHEDLDPWQRVSAALGYALYDPEQDKDVASVFRRADGRMYQCKRRMKGDNVR